MTSLPIAWHDPSFAPLVSVKSALAAIDVALVSVIGVPGFVGS